MSAKRASMKGAKGLLGEIAPRDKKKASSKAAKTSTPATGTRKAPARKKEIKWRKATIRFEESFFLKLKDKLAKEGRTLQGYIDYLIRRDLEKE